jgi:hypothetical protein
MNFVFVLLRSGKKHWETFFKYDRPGDIAISAVGLSLVAHSNKLLLPDEDLLLALKEI